MRTPIVAANWKMYKTAREAEAFCREFLPQRSRARGVELVLLPPFTALEAVARALEGSEVALGAQNLFWEEEGAYTGEISPRMLGAAGCSYVVIGHSERRRLFGETDEHVHRKVAAALGHALLPIVCVGETLEEREAGRTEEVVVRQVKAAFHGLAADEVARCVVAYEPVWAIGTGRNATGEDANQICGLIRRTLAGLYGEGAASAVRLQYGGSVKPENAAEFARQPEIDGALVGGASLEPGKFIAIAEAFVP
ncbi:MAG: triose-phosphate isomerase [Bacillota bacterium]|nr:triose-phosphate isomerase [Bacillota bacterium]